MTPANGGSAAGAVIKMTGMQGGTGEDGYANNSTTQKDIFHALAKPRLAQALGHLCDTLLNPASARQPIHRRTHVAIADLGCSYGRNTLDHAEFILQTLQERWLNHISDRDAAEIQYFFSDLPCNDFNALFQSLQPYLYQNNTSIAGANDHRQLPKILAAGVPGSFYGRLFPSATLDLLFCSYSLHWLSQVPPSVVDRASPAWNGGHIWTCGARLEVAEAYAHQSQSDLKSFLTYRAQELVSGGILFLFAIASTQEEVDRRHDGLISFFESAWEEMVFEGLITMEEMDTFNIPVYWFSQLELESALVDVPEMEVLHMETIVDTAPLMSEQEVSDPEAMGQQWTGIIMSLTKPMVEEHLGKDRAQELFKKLKRIATQQASLNTRVTHDFVIATLRRL